MKAITNKALNKTIKFMILTNPKAIKFLNNN